MTTIRPAEPTDHATIARLFLELAVPDPPLDEATFRRAILPSTRVAIADDGALGAYLHFELLPQNLGVRHLVTAPLYRRRGLARTLLLDVIGIARERGIATWSLNVKPENAAALALYRSLGLAPAYEAEIFRVPWELAAALSEAFEERLPWTIAAPDDDAVIERAFGVATGLFASQRSRGRIVIVVGELRSPAAFASFDPHFPG
ncbi:MAG TPA: GNAT family N-acetyltransferase, partial [Polyangiaceae bacterium]|nr:GNAT family N-acetyltransferase [Polyangiaceae bacterium]